MSDKFQLTDFRLEAGRYTLRFLSGDEADVAAYRDLRVRIRASDDARNFADSYTREDAHNKPADPAQVLALWENWCNAKREHCILGVFDEEKAGNKLISI